MIADFFSISFGGRFVQNVQFWHRTTGLTDSRNFTFLSWLAGLNFLLGLGRKNFSDLDQLAGLPDKFVDHLRADSRATLFHQKFCYAGKRFALFTQYQNGLTIRLQT